MKKIIKNIALIVLAGCLFVIYSCDDEFFKKEPPGTAAGSVLESKNGVDALLIAAYNSLYGGNYWTAAIFGGSVTMWEWGEISSDNAYFGAGATSHDIESYIMMPTSAYPERRWNHSYDGVNRANDVLVFLEKAQGKNEDISNERAIEIEAEAKFLRAYHHFQLQLVFWQIPYIKTIKEMEGKDPATIPNDSKVWDDIENDLQFAIDNLPEDPPEGDVGRADQYAAMAIKSRVHMFQQEYNEAKALLDAIINSGKFALVDHYYDNYDATTENNIESIWEIQCNISEADEKANALPVQGLCFHRDGPVGFGWGAYQPSQNLFEAFQVNNDGLPVLDVDQRDPLENDMGVPSSEEFQPTDHLIDPRVDWTIARRGIPYLDWGIHEGNSWIRSQIDGGPYMTKKFIHFKSNINLASSDNFKNARNFRAYRYAHVLLWRAEVAVEKGDLDYARNLVNMVRERAQGDYVMGRCETYTFDGREIQVDWNQPAANYLIEPYPSGHEAFQTQELARKAVRVEWRLEFATEGLRFFQLRRWGIDNEVLNNYIEEDSEFRYFMQGRTYNSEVNDYWPLPEAQLDIQPVLMQDPAYE